MFKFIAPFLLGALAVSAQNALLATGFAYDASDCTSSSSANFAVYGDANTCYPLTAYKSGGGFLADIASARVGTIPALQYYDECEVQFFIGDDCTGFEVPGVINQCSSAGEGNTFESVFVKCS